MILISDCGSTKSAWKWMTDSGIVKGVVTSGINPFFRTTDQIYNELNEFLLPHTGNQIQHIYFYGSGVINAEKGNIVKEALRTLYPHAVIETESDIVGAARALFGNKSGIAAILGTGSNVTLYDGNGIADGVPPMGFILGDEGSGAVLGKNLIGDYFKKTMPEFLRERFFASFPVTKDEVLQRVYKQEKPNEFLASFTTFLSDNLTERYVRELLRNSFISFFERNVLQINDFQKYSIGFVGSIAYYFQANLLEVCSLYNMKCHSILKEPIDGLSNYHFNKPFKEDDYDS